MNPPLVISPHLDDGALSCGQLITGYPGTVVVSCLATEPADWRAVTTHDGNSGFRSARDAVRARRMEDQRALQVLGAQPLYGPYVDSQYGEPMPAADELGAWLVEIVAETLPAFVVGPLGLAHPDHRLVADAFMAAAPAMLTPTWVYEELPSRVLWPEEVPRRLEHWRDHGWVLEFDNPGGALPARKARALREYKSQLRMLDWHALLVPERYYRAAR